MSSSAFQDRVKAELEANNWTVLNTGWPDFLCVKGDEVRIMEVKSDGDAIRINQKTVLDILSRYIPTRTIHPGPGFGDSENSPNFHILRWHEPEEDY